MKKAGSFACFSHRGEVSPLPPFGLSAGDWGRRAEFLSLREILLWLRPKLLYMACKL